MDVIGVGFGRTGTLSLKVALEQLGFGPCMHMMPLLEDPWRASLLGRAADGEAACLDAAFDGYRSTVDWPGTFFWRELTAAHPAAQVILTTRDPGDWYDSAYRTIYAAATMDGPLPQVMVAGREMAEKTVWQGTFGGRFADREAALQLFQEHNAAVRAEIAPDRLLEFTVSEGWGPLCDFLGAPVPDAPFPRLNDGAGFHRALRERLTLIDSRSGS
ncbi:sulfotransferase family protein [Actinoplanes sp. KI2]|uniref:sulfotransferase family protein n=1 Tax=Actinoplanes sp. KI2 TaxID=2983315 RepID=UPI0021D60BBE|nr:sulfotransferase family protein [Actinoplanes sp. KI2]MCU7728959.1 sulfotransferase family protein [Actinoplanes sp. KI2]